MGVDVYQGDYEGQSGSEREAEERLKEKCWERPDVYVIRQV